jgi:hypothetical protein
MSDSWNDSLQRNLHMISANPIPVALIGIGAAWLIASNTGMTDRIAHDARAARRRVADTASDMSRRAGELASGAAQRVGLSGSGDHSLGHTGYPGVDRDQDQGEGWVHQVSDRASGALRSARDSSGAMLNRVGSYAGAGGVSDALDRNPLIIGAIGIMAGALIAALVPMSAGENELFGAARDALWHRAEEAGEEAVQRVREAASDAAVRAVDAAAGAAVESVRHVGEKPAQG